VLHFVELGKKIGKARHIVMSIDEHRVELVDKNLLPYFQISLRRKERAVCTYVVKKKKKKKKEWWWRKSCSECTSK
jgi:hypothetical protein